MTKANKTTKTSKTAFHSKDTVLTVQEKQAHFDAVTAGKSEAFKTNFMQLHIDARSYAIGDESGLLCEASGDMHNAVTMHPRYGFTDAVQDQIERLGLNVSQIYRAPDAKGAGCAMKAIKRFHQAMHACAGAFPHREVDTVSALTILTLRAAGAYPLTEDALLVMGTGTNKAGIEAANLRGINRASVTAQIVAFKNKNKGTMQSQLKRSIGPDGFLVHIGAVNRTRTGTGVNDFEYRLNADNAFTKLILAAFDGLTDAQAQDFAENLKVTA